MRLDFLVKSTGILTKVFCISDLNFVILTWTADELSCRQESDWYTHTDTRTGTQMQAMTIPECQNWPRVKIKLLCIYKRWWNIDISSDGFILKDVVAKEMVDRF